MAKRTKHLCEQCGLERNFESNRKTCDACRRFNARVGRGEVLPPDYADTTYKPYKDPMIKNDTGFGYIGAIVQTKSGSHIQCNLCGYFFGDLGLHIANYHREDVREYKIRFGLRVKQGLLSPQVREIRQRIYNEKPLRHSNAENSIKARAALKKKRDEGEKAYNVKEGSWIPQLRNERGQCAAQLLEKIKELAKMMNTRPTEEKFISEYGWGAMESVKTLHGSWSKAVKKAGFDDYNAHRKKQSLKKVDEIIKDVIDWYETHERTPQWSDFNNDDTLPSYFTVKHHFKGLNALRRAAGIPELINVGGQWVESE